MRNWSRSCGPDLNHEWDYSLHLEEISVSIMIRVILPFHLRTLAHAGNELGLEIAGPVTVLAVLDALEARYPMLRGTIRDHGTLQRRPFLRFFACEEDLSHSPPDAPLPEAVVSGKEPFIIIGAIAGG
jgi:molybdopterin synthase sulfur carrier subunit